MMDKAALMQLNRVPEGKPPWLDYKAFRKLQQLFERLDPPEEQEGLENEEYCRLHAFLVDVAGLPIPESQMAVHLNAFLLSRRGYQVEEITETEYARLLKLLAGTEKADLDDMELNDFGNHRALYQYLTEGLGVYVEPGRGPVWHRAMQLVKHHEQMQESHRVLETTQAG